MPIIRPLVLLDQTDANTFDLHHVYHFGNEILVAPIIKPNATTREVYLPAGNWLDFWTNQRHAGRQTIQWTSPNQGRFPLFARQGAIIPMLLTDAQTLCEANYVNNPQIVTPDSGLLFTIYPEAVSRFSVFDGTEIECRTGLPQTTITLSSPARRVLLQILAPTPSRVIKDGAAVPQMTTAADFEASETGWRSDSATGLTLVKFQHQGAAAHIDLE
jgi:alpha-D-xyloside xylohydrolase